MSVMVSTLRLLVYGATSDQISRKRVSGIDVRQAALAFDQCRCAGTNMNPMRTQIGFYKCNVGSIAIAVDEREQ